MSRVADYLEVTESEAARQWRRILDRTPKPRQETFLPIEVLLCYGLFFLISPNKYGGANIHTLPPEVHRLAGLLKRTPGSLTNKMLNLDGSRTNAGRHEPEVFVRLSVDQRLYAELYVRILKAGWSLGISPDDLPDFLGAFDSDLTLLGQDEIGSKELETLLHQQEQHVRDLSQAFDFSTRETTRLVEHKARLGQHRFARDVLQNYGHACGFCGFAPRSLPGSGLIIASHIKPWAVSTDRERLDPRNGIAACPVHDSAFDSGLITVNGGYRIHRAGPLNVSMASDTRVSYYFGAPNLADNLIAPPRGAPLKRYLDYHKSNIFGADAGMAHIIT